MKKVIAILTLSIVLFSCSKDDEPTSQPLVKVIDKINIKKTFSGGSNFVIDRLVFEYNDNKEISKISRFENDDLFYIKTFVYQNNLPVSSMLDNFFFGDPLYELTYGYTNGIFSSYHDTYYDDTTIFSYNSQFNQFTNSINGNRFVLNESNDFVSRTASGNEYAFSYDTTKKGPLYNVVNKKWIPSLWYAISALTINEMSTFPITSLFDDNLAQTNPYTNTYDADGFITKSVFTINNGDQAYEITYIYKSI